MHADELRMAVTKVVEVLSKADIKAVIDQYRAANSDQRTAAAARLGHAGAVIMERIDAMSAAERQVIKCLHLESLGSADYWQNLLGSADEPKKHQAEIVRLASRVMFASSHLPGMMTLMSSVKDHSGEPANQPQALESGEGRLCIRLTDAGERASDPDRVARAIDGVDMLYSACASIARKPAMDLRVDAVSARRNRDRDIQFTGERDSIAAVFAVIDSIPAALADIEPDQDIDLNSVVQSLPIFEDLNTLASLGTFSKKDLKDISETMHQGALLTLESGVILVNPELGEHKHGSAAVPAGNHSAMPVLKSAQADLAMPGIAQRQNSAAEESVTQATRQPAQQTAQDNDRSAAESDEHYNRYLREREAMLRAQPAAGAGINGHMGSQGIPGTSALNGAVAKAGSEDQNRRDAVDDLLKALGQSRGS